MALLDVKEIAASIGSNRVLEDISFTQNDNEKIAIAGATGSGKSSLLRVIGGLMQPDKGVVIFNGERVRGPLEELIPGHPRIAYLTQDFSLRNNYYVHEILEYANQLDLDAARTLYDICDIGHLLQRRTSQLSGGERQRIALARLLVTSPQLLLLDEPFSNLDAIHKSSIKAVIRQIGERLGISCILVSHEAADILSWADTLLLMQDGHIVQRGSPENVYRNPASRYCAELLGPANEIPASWLRRDGTGTASSKVFLRPDEFVLSRRHQSAIDGRVERVDFMGYGYLVTVTTGSGHLLVSSETGSWKQGEQVWLTLLRREG